MARVISTVINLQNNTKEALKQMISDASKAAKQMEELQSIIDEQKDIIDNANIALNKAKENYENLTKEVLNNSKSYRDAIKSIENLKDKNASIIQTIREHQSIAENLKNEYGESSSAYKEAKKQLQQLEKEQRSNLRSIKEQEKALKSLSNDVLNNSEAINEAKAQMKQYEDTIESAEKSIKETQQEFKELGKIVKENSKNFEKAKDTVKSWGNSLISSIDGAILKAAKWGAATASLVGGFAVKTGLETSFNLEAYRTQLQTAVKDTEKATKLMNMAVNLSNATPFTSQETIASTSMLETYGIDSTEWLTSVADMAGATNKELEQATSALIDAINKNEFQGLEEFGISKEMLQEEAQKGKWKDLKIFKKSGEIQSQEEFKNLLQATMTSKFGGGAEDLSKTVKGLWSTVKGITETSLAGVLGMDTSGLIRAGSVLDMFKEKLQLVADTLMEWQKDGTIQEIAEKFTNAFNIAIEKITEIYSYIKENKDTILIYLKMAGIIYAIAKSFIFLSETIKAVKVVMALLNATMFASPMGIVIGIIGMIIASLAALQNPQIIAFLKTLGKVIFGAFKVVFGVIMEVIKGIGDIFSGIEKGWKFIKGLFSDEEVEKTVKVKEEYDANDEEKENRKKSNFISEQDLETQKIITDLKNGSLKEENETVSNALSNIELPNYDTFSNLSFDYPTQDVINNFNDYSNENLLSFKNEKQDVSIPYIYPAGLLKESETLKETIKEKTIQKEKITNNTTTAANNTPIQNTTKNFNIEINGDVYGIEDLENKIAEVFVKVYETEVQNAV